MKNEDKKKGLFGGLLGGKKDKKETGCCNLEIEEIQEDAVERVKEKIHIQKQRNLGVVKNVFLKRLLTE